MPTGSLLASVLLLHWDDDSLVAPRAARAALRTTLRGSTLTAEMIDDTVLATSELVANAVQHAPGPYELWLRRTARQLLCEVHDRDARLPQTLTTSRLRMPHGGRDASEGVAALPERGRGLQLVEELTGGCWGFRIIGGCERDSWKKIAWLAMPLPSTLAAHAR